MANSTAILLIDPYNDFLHPDGKATPALAQSLKEANTITRLETLVQAARKHGIPIFYGLHKQSDQYTFKGWDYLNAFQQKIEDTKVFEEGGFGAQIYKGLESDPTNGDVIVNKHWNSSSFENTDLDYQLRRRGITSVVLPGLVANTCLEATARYAYEYGYHVTMLGNATAGFTVEAHKAGVELIWPLFAEVTTVGQWIAGLGEKL